MFRKIIHVTLILALGPITNSVAVADATCSHCTCPDFVCTSTFNPSGDFAWSIEQGPVRFDPPQRLQSQNFECNGQTVEGQASGFVVVRIFDSEDWSHYCGICA